MTYSSATSINNNNNNNLLKPALVNNNNNNKRDLNVPIPPRANNSGTHVVRGSGDSADSNNNSHNLDQSQNQQQPILFHLQSKLDTVPLAIQRSDNSIENVLMDEALTNGTNDIVLNTVTRPVMGGSGDGEVLGQNKTGVDGDEQDPLTAVPQINNPFNFNEFILDSESQTPIDESQVVSPIRSPIRTAQSYQSLSRLDSTNPSNVSIFDHLPLPTNQQQQRQEPQSESPQHIEPQQQQENGNHPLTIQSSNSHNLDQQDHISLSFLPQNDDVGGDPFIIDTPTSADDPTLIPSPIRKVESYQSPPDFDSTNIENHVTSTVTSCDEDDGNNDNNNTGNIINTDLVINAAAEDNTTPDEAWRNYL